MIWRLWCGWTTIENADSYQALLQTEILPGIHRVDGFHGAYFLRRNTNDGVEFMTITMFDSMHAVRDFAGEDYAIAVVPPAARALLSTFEQTAVHYDSIQLPDF